MSTQLSYILQEKQQLSKKLKAKEQENVEFHKDHNGLIKRFMFEMEKKKAELEINQMHLREALISVEKGKAESKAFSIENEKSIKATLFMEDHLKRMIRERDEQISDIMSK